MFPLNSATAAAASVLPPRDLNPEADSTLNCETGQLLRAISATLGGPLIVCGLPHLSDHWQHVGPLPRDGTYFCFHSDGSDSTQPQVSISLDRGGRKVKISPISLPVASAPQSLLRAAATAVRIDRLWGATLAADNEEVRELQHILAQKIHASAHDFPVPENASDAADDRMDDRSDNQASMQTDALLRDAIPALLGLQRVQTADGVAVARRHRHRSMQETASGEQTLSPTSPATTPADLAAAYDRRTLLLKARKTSWPLTRAAATASRAEPVRPAVITRRRLAVTPEVASRGNFSDDASAAALMDTASLL
jgi:hypothetical protein